MSEAKYLIEIIKYLLNKADSKVALVQPSADMDWGQLMAFAKKHNVANLLHYVMPKIEKAHRPSEELCCRIRNYALNIAAIDVQQQLEKENLFRQFEQEGLYCLPVKGLETKELYPEREWRTMGDFDVLYKTEQHKQVKDLLLNTGYTAYRTGLKHDHYYKKPYVSLEMHRVLVAPDTVALDYYETIWEKVKPKASFEHVYEMSLEEHYIYTMVHLIEHFKVEGVGIRFIMDIFVIGQQKALDWEYIRDVFKQMKVSEFVDNIERLAWRWFGNEYVPSSEEKEQVIDELEEFIFNNGAFGDDTHAYALVLQREGRFKYIMRMVFPSYDNMKTLYMWLENRKCLLPVAWTWRIFRTILFHKKSIEYGMNTIRYKNKQHGRKLQEFYKKCGI